MSASVFVRFNRGGLFSGWDGVAWCLVHAASRAMLSCSAECFRGLLPVGVRYRKGIGKSFLLFVGGYCCLAITFLRTVGSNPAWLPPSMTSFFRIGWKLACVFSQ